MKDKERQGHRRAVRKLLTSALFVLEHDPEVSLIQTMQAVSEFANWLDADRVREAIRAMTKDV